MIPIEAIFNQGVAVVSSKNQVDKYEFSQNIICPECKGDGEVATRDVYVYDSEWEYLTCCNCNGSGIVKVSVDIRRVV